MYYLALDHIKHENTYFKKNEIKNHISTVICFPIKQQSHNNQEERLSWRLLFASQLFDQSSQLATFSITAFLTKSDKIRMFLKWKLFNEVVENLKYELYINRHLFMINFIDSLQKKRFSLRYKRNAESIFEHFEVILKIRLLFKRNNVWLFR